MIFFLVLAQQVPDGNSLPLLAQYGLLAPFMIALWFAFKREAARADRLEAEVQRLNTVAQEKTLPAMFQVAESLQDFGKLAADLKLRQEVDRRAKDKE